MSPPFFTPDLERACFRMLAASIGWIVWVPRCLILFGAGRQADTRAACLHLGSRYLRPPYGPAFILTPALFLLPCAQVASHPWFLLCAVAFLYQARCLSTRAAQ